MIVLEDIAGSEGMKDGELHRWAYISTSGRTSSQFAIGVMQGGARNQNSVESSTDGWTDRRTRRNHISRTQYIPILQKLNEKGVRTGEGDVERGCFT